MSKKSHFHKALQRFKEIIKKENYPIVNLVDNDTVVNTKDFIASFSFSEDNRISVVVMNKRTGRLLTEVETKLSIEIKEQLNIPRADV